MSKGISITFQDIAKVEELLQAGMSVEAVARILEYSPITVRRIKNGEHILQVRSGKQKENQYPQLHNELLGIYNILEKMCDILQSIASEFGVKKGDDRT